MKITFKKRHLNSNLFYGFFFTVIALIMLKSNQDPWHAILSIVLPILYVAKYFLRKHYQYLTLDKGVIKVNHLFGKEIKMTEINQIEKYAGTYIIKTDTKKLSIDTHIIEKKSLIALNTVLENLNVAWV
jgi:hypothetical protein